MFDGKRYTGRVSVPLEADTFAALEAVAKDAGASVAAVTRECIPPWAGSGPRGLAETEGPPSAPERGRRGGRVNYTLNAEDHEIIRLTAQQMADAVMVTLPGPASGSSTPPSVDDDGLPQARPHKLYRSTGPDRMSAWGARRDP